MIHVFTIVSGRPYKARNSSYDLLPIHVAKKAVLDGLQAGETSVPPSSSPRKEVRGIISSSVGASLLSTPGIVGVHGERGMNPSHTIITAT